MQCESPDCIRKAEYQVTWGLTTAERGKICPDHLASLLLGVFDEIDPTHVIVTSLETKWPHAQRT